MEKILKWSDRATLFLFCVLMADCAIFGAGRTIAIGSVGFRMIVVGLIMLVSLPIMIKKIPEIIRDKFFWMLFAFLCWLIVQTIAGIKNGHQFSHIITDLKGFAYLAVFLPALCVLTSRERIYTLMKVMMYSTLVISASAIFLLFSYNWFPEVFTAFYVYDNNFYISAFSGVAPRVVRLFFKSSNYLLCGCAFPLYFAVTSEKKKINWLYASIIGVSLFNLLMTYTRSIYLAVAVSAVFIIIICVIFASEIQRKKLWQHIIAAVLVFCLVLTFLSVVMEANFLAYAFDRVGLSFMVPKEEPTETEPTEPVDEYQQQTISSDVIRKMTLEEQWKFVGESPIIGHGLGKAVTCREDGLSEYFYIDLITKTGIIGLILYLLPILTMLVITVRRKGFAAQRHILAGSWVAVLLEFSIFSYFNPYMNASLGVLYYCCTMAVFHMLDREQKRDSDKRIA